MKMLTVSNVAEVLQISKSMVRNLINSGQIPAIDLTPGSERRTWRVPSEVLDIYVLSHMKLTGEYIKEINSLEGR